MLNPILPAAAAIVLALATALPVTTAHAQIFENSSNERCNAGFLNFIPQIVRRETVAAVKPGANVSIHQVCAGLQLNDLGNAAGLTHTIAANPTLASALASWGWRPDNVVGINVISDRNVVLYVYQSPV